MKDNIFKNNIIIFVIGLLLGAVIATGAFYVYSKATVCNSNNNQNSQMPGGQPPEMPQGQNGGGQPPEMPQGQNSSDSSNGQPPEKTSDNNSNNSESNNN